MTQSIRTTPLLALATILSLAGCQIDTGSTPPSGAAPAKDALAQTISIADASILNRLGKTNANCHMDLAQGVANTGTVTLNKKSGASFEGWAAINGDSTADNATLIFSSSTSYGVPVNTGIERSDVARATNSKSLLKSGFKVIADLSSLPAGDYQLALWTQLPAPSSLCDLKTHVTVLP